jgi:hypothetical protein
VAWSSFRSGERLWVCADRPARAFRGFEAVSRSERMIILVQVSARIRLRRLRSEHSALRRLARP